jgi:hypothetical protein
MCLCLSVLFLAIVFLLHLPPNESNVTSLCSPLPWKSHGSFGLVLEIRHGVSLAAFITQCTEMHGTATLGSKALYALFPKPSPICLQCYAACHHTSNFPQFFRRSCGICAPVSTGTVESDMVTFQQTLYNLQDL